MAFFSTLISTVLKMLFIGKKKESQKMRFLFKFHYIDKPSKSLYN